MHYTGKKESKKEIILKKIIKLRKFVSRGFELGLSETATTKGYVSINWTTSVYSDTFCLKEG